MRLRTIYAVTKFGKMEGRAHRKPETCACRDCLGTTGVV
jgi:hypothetical protein